MKTSFISALALGAGAVIIGGMWERAVVAQGEERRDDVPGVFQAAGPTSASIAGTLGQFRLAIGGDDNRNAPGLNPPLTAGRREINWDGGGAATSLGESPLINFLDTRGALFTTPGSGFVQAPPAGIAATFGNESYATAFQAFSLQRLFSASFVAVLFDEPRIALVRITAGNRAPGPDDDGASISS